MPVAVIDPNNFKRYELKSAPPDGYVMLRPLPFGMLLDRQDETLLMQMKARKPQDRRRKGQADELPTIDMRNLNRKATEGDFAYCIGEHNLTDFNGQLLDLSNPLVFKVLDPRISQEIAEYIDELNNPPEVDDEDFIKRATSLRGEKNEQASLLPMEDLST